MGSFITKKRLFSYKGKESEKEYIYTLLNHRAVHLCGGQRIDTKTGDHQEHMGRVGGLAQLAHFAAQVRVHHVQEQHAAKEMRRAHRVAPDTHGTNQENKILRLRIEGARRQQQGETHQQAEKEQPAGRLQKYMF